MKAENLKKVESVQIRITKDLKVKFFNIAKINGLIPSKLVRSFIESLIYMEPSELKELGRR